MERVLTPQQLRALEEAERWVVEAYTGLGKATLEHDVIRKRFLASERHLEQTSLEAREAVVRRAKVLLVLGRVLELPDGEWSFDPAGGKLVSKEPGT